MKVKSNFKIIAMDLDGTLTQHKSPLEPECRKVLEKLSEKYKLVMVCAGSCERVYNQLESFPVDILGCYGMEFSKVVDGEFKLVEKNVVEINKKMVSVYGELIRKEFGFTEYVGDSVEFHSSGLITFPILGTKALLEDKLKYDPDRKKRKMYFPRVCEIFEGYNVFIGGTSSFDIAPKPYNKLYALDKYLKLYNYERKDVVFFGDDYGAGGNDNDVFESDIKFIKIDDYRKFPEIAGKLLLL
ncbi:MAG: HAD family phosphatase [Ruminococcaceae bacterium]|nr:HAD family phosphatase [Oscillospiraceae bacterium]